MSLLDGCAGLRVSRLYAEVKTKRKQDTEDVGHCPEDDDKCLLSREVGVLRQALTPFPAGLSIAPEGSDGLPPLELFSQVKAARVPGGLLPFKRRGLVEPFSAGEGWFGGSRGFRGTWAFDGVAGTTLGRPPSDPADDRWLCVRRSLWKRAGSSSCTVFFASRGSDSYKIDYIGEICELRRPVNH